MKVPQPLYLFDGYCVLCSGFVQFCLRHDGDQQLKFASTQSAFGRDLVKSLGLPPETTDRTVLLIDGDRVYSQSTAVLRSLRHLRGWPRLLQPLALVPRFVRDPVYELIARNRYRWFGRRTSCFVPTPQIRDRFVDLR